MPLQVQFQIFMEKITHLPYLVVVDLAADAIPGVVEKFVCYMLVIGCGFAGTL